MTRHAHDLTPWQHDHRFDSGNPHGEARTRGVLALTIATMAAEIAAGWWTGSMALLADGWHMGTHALALGVAALAVGAVELVRDLGRATLVLGQHQLDPGVSAVQAPGRVDPRGELERQVALV